MELGMPTGVTICKLGMHQYSLCALPTNTSYPVVAVTFTDVPRAQEGGVLRGLESDATRAVCALCLVGL